jgi:hypothetical protein
MILAKIRVSSKTRDGFHTKKGSWDFDNKVHGGYSKSLTGFTKTQLHVKLQDIS